MDDRDRTVPTLGWFWLALLALSLAVFAARPNTGFVYLATIPLAGALLSAWRAGNPTRWVLLGSLGLLGVGLVLSMQLLAVSGFDFDDAVFLSDSRTVALALWILPLAAIALGAIAIANWYLHSAARVSDTSQQA